MHSQSPRLTGIWVLENLTNPDFTKLLNSPYIISFDLDFDLLYVSEVISVLLLTSLIWLVLNVKTNKMEAMQERPFSKNWLNEVHEFGRMGILEFDYYFLAFESNNKIL